METSSLRRIVTPATIMTADRSWEVVTLVGVGLLLAALTILVLEPPAAQYEISLYEAYPIYLWGLLVAAFFLGEMVILTSAQRRNDWLWQPALALVLLTNATLLLMPYIRGYPIYGRTDALTHIGRARDIVELGTIAGDNIYPSTHILIQTVSYTTGVDLMNYAVLIPIAYSSVYFGSMYYLLTTLFDSRRDILFRLPFTMLPVLGTAYVGVRPFDLSLLLTPFVFYLFIKSQRESSPTVRVAFVLASIAYVLLHPLAAIFLILIFGVWTAATRIPRLSAEYIRPTNVFSLVFVFFIAWYQNYQSILLRFEQVTETLLGQASGSPPIQNYANTVDKASPPLIDLFRVWLFRFGVEFVVFALGFGFLCLMLLFLYRGWYSVDSYVILFASTLVAFSLGGVSFLLFDLIVGMDRPFQFAKIGGVVLAGGLFYLLWEYVDYQPPSTNVEVGFSVSIGLVLLLLVVLTTYGIYPSPLSSKKNFQVTEQELEGSEWLSGKEAEVGMDVNTIGIRYFRFYEAQNGVIEEKPLDDKVLPPPHFNYTETEQYGQNFEEDRYLIVTRLGRTVYPSTFPDYRQFWRYTPSDFERIERDRTVSHVYDNGDFDLYSIQGTGPVNRTAVSNEATASEAVSDGR